MENTSAERCAVCLGGVGPGQAIFKAECSHTFHFRCVSGKVAHGSPACPTCNATWRDVPAVDPAQAAASRVPPPEPPSRRVVIAEPPREYADDDPVAVESVAAGAQGADGAAGVGQVVLETHCERRAVPRGEAHDGFALLVHARAPGAADADADAPRAPLDLVTVLDVSGSMSGEKLALLKQAMGFVIDNLGPADRLSVVSFSSSARRVLKLARMSGRGKDSAKRAVESLAAAGSTNIAAGLLVGSQVLANRRHTNAVTGIILLSDGKDTCGHASKTDLVPPSFRAAGAGTRTAPIHTFGFGTDYDAAAMHTIAEETRGTFSYIENQAVVQDSFAQCIGGLLSVTMQNVRIDVACVHPGVRLREVKSGRYESRVDADGRAASVDVGELYADEERRFLLFVDVPAVGAADDEATRLVSVRCAYRDPATGRAAEVASADDAAVLRPVEVADGDAEPSMEVERERVRVAAAEDIAAARAAAERGAHAEAARILELRMELVRLSAPGRAGDPACAELEDELREIRDGVADRREYRRVGYALMACGMSSHAQQRASFRGGVHDRPTFRTKRMEVMIKKSMSLRLQQPMPTPTSTRPSPPAKKQNKERGNQLNEGQDLEPSPPAKKKRRGNE